MLTPARAVTRTTHLGVSPHLPSDKEIYLLRDYRPTFGVVGRDLCWSNADFYNNYNLKKKMIFQAESSGRQLWDREIENKTGFRLCGVEIHTRLWVLFCCKACPDSEKSELLADST